MSQVIMLLILRIISFFTGRRIVLLQDFQGEINYTLEKIDSSFTKTAYIYFFTKTGEIILNNNGTVKGRTYIERWEYV